MPPLGPRRDCIANFTRAVPILRQPQAHGRDLWKRAKKTETTALVPQRHRTDPRAITPTDFPTPTKAKNRTRFKVFSPRSDHWQLCHRTKTGLPLQAGQQGRSSLSLGISKRRSYRHLSPKNLEYGLLPYSRFCDRTLVSVQIHLRLMCPLSRCAARAL